MKVSKRLLHICLSGIIVLFFGSCLSIMLPRVSAYAWNCSTFNVVWDEANQEVICEGIPCGDGNGPPVYQLRYQMTFENGEVIQNGCWGTEFYTVPERQAFIFSWTDKQFILPCDGTYYFKAWVRRCNGDSDESNFEDSDPITISFYYTKTDHSGDWEGYGKENVSANTLDNSSEDSSVAKSTDTNVTVDTIKNLKDTNQTLVIEAEDESTGISYTWQIDPLGVTDVPQSDVNLNIAFGKDTLIDGRPAIVYNNWQGDWGQKDNQMLWSTFTTEYDGELGFEPVLILNVGKEYAGRYANLFFDNGNGFLYISNSPVAEDGTIRFTFKHFSDYVITLGDAYDTNEYPELVAYPWTLEEKAESETEVKESFETTAVEEKTGLGKGTLLIIVLSLIVLAIGGGVVFFIKGKKQ